MRIWSLHPRYLDRQGLVACWRETLLAQAVLAGRTRGYTRHPQLTRFREQEDPIAAIAEYLHGVAGEADARGYSFDRARIMEREGSVRAIEVTEGQLLLEWGHLREKLAARSPEQRQRWHEVREPDPHPLFRRVAGPPAGWERALPPGDRGLPE